MHSALGEGFSQIRGVEIFLELRHLSTADGEHHHPVRLEAPARRATRPGIVPKHDHAVALGKKLARFEGGKLCGLAEQLEKFGDCGAAAEMTRIRNPWRTRSLPFDILG